MTQEHVHVWEPIPLRFGRYACACACGATAYRRRSGELVVHKAPLDVGPSADVSVSRNSNMGTGSGHSRHGKRGPGGW